tara:strand:+ start:1170 stop:3338 length:2169 start_codon:yes stop_codon:yes gene_type:complete
MPRKKYYPGYQMGGDTIPPQQDTTYPGPRFDPLSEEDIRKEQERQSRLQEEMQRNLDRIQRDHPSIWERIRELPIVQDMKQYLPKLPGVMWDAVTEIGGGIKDLLTPEQKKLIGPTPGATPGPPQMHNTIERERRLKERWDSEGRTAMGLDEEFDRLKRGSGIVGLQTGGAVPSQTTVTQHNMPVQTEQYWADTTKQGMDLTAPGQPYQEYGANRLAGLTDPQVAGMAGISAYGKGAGPQGTIQAGQAYGQAQGMLGSAANQMAGLSGQYGTLGSKFGAYAPLAQSQAQTTATDMGTTGTAANTMGTAAQTAMGATGTLAGTGGTTTATNLRAMGTTAAAPTGIAGQDLSGYMSQYTQGALDPKIAAIRQAAAQQRSEIGSQAAQAGAGGGYRHGLREGQVDVGEQAQIGQATGEAYQQALLNAQEQFRGDQSAKERGLATQIGAETGAGAASLRGLTEQGRMQQVGAQTGLLGLQQQGELQGQAGALQQQGFDTMSKLYGQQQGALTGQANLAQQQGAMGAQMGQLAGGMGDLGAREQQQQLERLRSMQDVGKEQQEFQQASLNMGYQDWQNKLNKPFEDLQKRMQVLSSTPYQGSTSTSQYAPPPNQFGQVMGAGIQGLDIWSKMRGEQPPGQTLGWPQGYDPSGQYRTSSGFNQFGTPPLPPGWGQPPPVMRTNIGQPYVPPGSVGGPHQYNVNAPGEPQWPTGLPRPGSRGPDPSIGQ